MLKEFNDATTGRKVLVNYYQVFLVTESHNGACAIVSGGGAAVPTGIPYKEIVAWMHQCDRQSSAAMGTPVQ